MVRDRYTENLGIKRVDVEKEYARCELEINDTHKNGLGSLHGAVTFALADIAFAAVCKCVQSSKFKRFSIYYIMNVFQL
jgi:acyl-CoA thioesterase